MFHIIISEEDRTMAREAFQVMEPVLHTSEPVLGLATGSSPEGLYREMVRDHNQNGTSYRNVVTFNLDEYVGLPRSHRQSYWTFMHEKLFDFIDIPEQNIHVPAGDAADAEEECRQYEAQLQQHQVSIQVLGIGSDGHIGFNEPGTPFESVTHVAELTAQTRLDNARFFGGDVSRVPGEAITMGLASIMRARKILLIAAGKNKAQAVRNMIEGPVNADCPASILARHPDVTVILDQEAASLLTHSS